jgi:hypothetical protein
MNYLYVFISFLLMVFLSPFHSQCQTISLVLNDDESEVNMGISFYAVANFSPGNGQSLSNFLWTFQIDGEEIV